jgi:AAHS family 4-hydroxybenzoate transporter-like MFS transporter
MSVLTGTREQHQAVDRGQYLAPLVGLMMIMIDGYDLQSIGYVAPEIARAWSLDIAAFGMVFAAGLAGTIPGAMLAGPAARRFGPGAVLKISLLVFGVGSLATAQAGDLSQLTLLRFMVGIGLGAAIPIVLSSVAQNSPARFRAAFVTAAGCGQPIGAILGSALCARLIPAFGWKSAFILGGVLPLLIIPGVKVLLEGRGPRDDLASSAKAADRPSGRVQDLFSREFRATTLLIWAAASLCVCCLYVIVNWLPGIVRGRGYSFENSLLVIGLFNTGTLIGALVFGALIDRFGPFKVLPTALLAGGVFLSLLDVSLNSRPLLLAAALLSGFTGGGGGMCLAAMLVLLYPSTLRTTGTGWALAFAKLFAALGPIAIAFALRAGLAKEHLFYFAGGAAAVAALCLITLEKVRAGSVSVPGDPANGKRIVP